jgi:hypothetical protein
MTPLVVGLMALLGTYSAESAHSWCSAPKELKLAAVRVEFRHAFDVGFKRKAVACHSVSNCCFGTMIATATFTFCCETHELVGFFVGFLYSFHNNARESGAVFKTPKNEFVYEIKSHVSPLH